jgi:alanine dehydrogenase
LALFLTEKDVSSLLTMDMALDVVEEAFRLQAEGKATNNPRSRMRLPGGAFHFMAAAAPGLGVMGLKAYAISQNAQPRFYVHLSSADTGELLAIIEASRLGQVRTGAASGVATRHMARKDASTVGIIGCGYQAHTQLEAVCRVREIRAARVFSRTPEHRERFASEMSVRLGIAVTAVDSAEVCVRGSEIVITVTSSSTPVLSGEWLSPGAHVNAVGANHWLRRELDDEAVRRANVVVADDIEQAKIECGDLIYPIERGILRWEQVHSLSDVVAGRAMGRANEGDITLFESQGLALEDIAVGIRVYRLARERGIGRELPF